MPDSISSEFYHILLSLEVLIGVPWHPHCALLLTLLASPRSIQGLVQCIPRPLPLVEFQDFWKSVSPDEQISFWRKAEKRAKHILEKQKAHTGVAILGRPSPQLVADPNFQGPLREVQIQVGEKLALASRQEKCRSVASQHPVTTTTYTFSSSNIFNRWDHNKSELSPSRHPNNLIIEQHQSSQIEFDQLCLEARHNSVNADVAKKLEWSDNSANKYLKQKFKKKACNHTLELRPQNKTVIKAALGAYKVRPR